jgi:hypothetical protein
LEPFTEGVFHDLDEVRVERGFPADQLDLLDAEGGGLADDPLQSLTVMVPCPWVGPA